MKKLKNILILAVIAMLSMPAPGSAQQTNGAPAATAQWLMEDSRSEHRAAWQIITPLAFPAGCCEKYSWNSQTAKGLDRRPGKPERIAEHTKRLKDWRLSVKDDPHIANRVALLSS
jgi:hypothetical protein